MEKELSREEFYNLLKEVSVMSKDEGEKKYKMYYFGEGGLLVGKCPSNLNIIEVKGSKMRSDGDFGFLVISDNVQKGTFTGSALNKGVFKFMANRPYAECSYCYQSNNSKHHG